ncbi:hypothetical protein [Rhodobium gokarnense]|uniref:CHASE2 domain-containing sensor protein n=1 Tax=Rhodobium gokarnense TaxID=364296 RepID=A0ABT3H7I8_9HYPH|nr:hypothetical protein [Rhodobium gokarnense]MCW2306299.1 CHASE2 domain-containing sensor protein [Rhodobium gokarnense]
MGEATRLVLIYAVCGLPVLLVPGWRTLGALAAAWAVVAVWVVTCWEPPDGLGFSEKLFVALLVVAGFVGVAAGIGARALILFVHGKGGDRAPAYLGAGLVYAIPPLAFFLLSK